MAKIYIGLGSNLGDRQRMMASAIEAIREIPGTRLLRLSSIRETAPAGGPPQGKYLNAVVELDTAMSPRQLFDALKTIERSLGRMPSVRWGPRLIDLDLIFFGAVMMEGADLTVPHPRLWERAFVLEPLVELRPDLVAAGPEGWRRVMAEGCPGVVETGIAGRDVG